MRAPTHLPRGAFGEALVLQTVSTHSLEDSGMKEPPLLLQIQQCTHAQMYASTHAHKLSKSQVFAPQIKKRYHGTKIHVTNFVFVENKLPERCHSFKSFNFADVVALLRTNFSGCVAALKNNASPRRCRVEEQCFSTPLLC